MFLVFLIDDFSPCQAEALEWTREVKDSEEVCVIRQSDMDRLINSDGDNFFTSAEEVKLLFHLIQDIRVNKVVVIHHL